METINELLELLKLRPDEKEIFWAYYNGYHEKTNLDDPESEIFIIRNEIVLNNPKRFNTKIAVCICLAMCHTQLPANADDFVMEKMRSVL